MLLWISLAVLTAGVVAAIARPLLAGRDESLTASAADLAVYKDQLGEIDADRERGLIGETEAEAARNEVARRLLTIAGQSQANAARTRGLPSPATSSPDKRAYLIAAALIPILSIALYSVYGSPGLPAQPHLARVKAPVEQSTVGELVSRVEARLRENPDDAEGWDVIAPVYLRLERYQDAADAFGKALRLKGESPSRLGGFAEALVLSNGGIVSEEARSAYEKLSRLVPENPEPRFWLALAKEQDGKLADAAKDYTALLDKAPPDAPWRDAVADRLRDVLTRTGAKPEEIARIAGAAKSAAPAAGRGETPSSDAMAAAEQMSPEQRSDFINQMVEGLNARLKANGKDLQGWMRLVRAYKVMGKTGEAATALTDARRNFTGDSAALSQLDVLAKSLGLGS